MPLPPNLILSPSSASSSSTTASSATNHWLDLIAGHPTVRALRSACENTQPGDLLHATIHGGGTSAVSTVLAATLSTDSGNGQSPRPVLLVMAHLDDADETVDELRAAGLPWAQRFPALEVLPGESHVHPDLLAERLQMVNQFCSSTTGTQGPTCLVAPVHALMQVIPDPGRLGKYCLNLTRGDRRGPGAILQWLEEAGYTRADLLETPGQYAVRGGLIDIYPAGAGEDAAPIRLDFFGDELESIVEVDLATLASDRKVESAQIVGASVEALLADESGYSLLNILPQNTLVVLHELLEITEQARGYYERATSGGAVIGLPALQKQFRLFPVLQVDSYLSALAQEDRVFDLPFETLQTFSEDAAEAMVELAALTRDQQGGRRVVVICNSESEHERFRDLLRESLAKSDIHDASDVESAVGYLHRGFVWNRSAGTDDESARDERLFIVPYHELLHRYHTRRRMRRIRAGRTMDAFLDLKPGDFVVHRDHGIAQFVELVVMEVERPGSSAAGGWAENRAHKSRTRMQEYLTLEFAGGVKLHVPAGKIDLVQKYIGGYEGKPPLSHFGGRRWGAQKRQAQDAVRDLAGEMLRIQAARQHLPGIRYPDDTAWQKQFEAEFPYEETQDQLASISEIKKDMTGDRPMDRLLCGDVGFGKTELAIRAAFKAVEYGKQVAVLVPTTVLAEQHYRTFRQRFADYPFRIEVISRFQTGRESRDIVKDLKAGRVDVIIGTHRLLSKDVKFADLGLVIIDEEQRFGVEHKQKLLAYRMTADVLTLSATPIPRTLHMSMLGLRDISSLTTAPFDRRAVVTEVIPFNERRIAQAIRRELAREGQIYFVHNRVHNIRTVADQIQKLAPDARIIVGHGQMPDRELESVMLKFIRREADILVSTTIIESGIDIPTANTMFINEAENYGLADLHQLRGRVGRYKHRAYCYLLLSNRKSVSSVAAKRLKAIEEFSMLGAGFKIAMRDLEMRGAGDLLGPEQSGHIANVGYEMYCHLLESAVKEMKGEVDIRPIETEVELDLIGSIPRPYIPSDTRRMEAYRRICQARTVDDLNRVEREIVDAYGDLPKEARTLFALSEIRIDAAALGVRSVVRHEQDIVFRTKHPERIEEALAGVAGSVRTVRAISEEDQPLEISEVYFRPPAKCLSDGPSLLAVLRKRLGASGDSRHNEPRP